MSNNIAERLKVMRESERMNRREFSALTGIPYGTMSYYETGRSVPPAPTIMHILSLPRFLKYTLWFMTGTTAPESGQIAPALAHCGLTGTTSPHSDQKTG
ncbi:MULTISPECIES: helix-turn-helix domain-containing protein [Citrobacter freundii complex]|uniref:helix-turn-helix domain-containing protein n=1 Tax=Citrobacter freundii complex TaxID=1344959 RepID=UPI00295C54DE|nr:helix-turn-helix transcriptional regulator [Citrobacter freundii]HEF0026985.1 helix-turn-helix transcriptional regulator [Citrobacter freundii]